MKFTFFETIGKLIVRYHSFFEEGIINTLIIAAFAVLFGTIAGTPHGKHAHEQDPAAAMDRHGLH